MQTILVALACLVALFVAALLGRSAAGQLGLLLLVAGVLGLTFAAWFVALGRPRSRAPASATLVASGLVALALVRGAAVGAEERARETTKVERGRPTPPDLRELEVVGASEPGPRCTVEVRELGELELAASACPLAAGDRIALRSDELERADARVPSERSRWLAADEHPPWSRPGSASAPLERYMHFVAALRQDAWEVSRGDRALALGAAIGLGLRATLTIDDREALRDSGLGHLIAVSGLQVALAGLWLQVLVRRLALLAALSARWASVVTWVPLLAYVVLTGAAPPALRSAAMLIAVDLGTIVGRPTHGPTLLACVAALLAALEPSWLFDPGYQLSVVAMAAIVTAPPEQGVLASSWRITWTTLPLTLLHFDVAPIHALLANVLALPLFSLAMPTALLGWALLGTLGEAALAPMRVFTQPILDVAQLLARVPPLDARAIVVLALLGVIVHRVRARRARARREDIEPSDLLPPELACLATLLVALPLALGWPRPSLAAQLGRERFEWLALGTPRSSGLILRDRRQGSLAPAVCIVRPLLGPRETEVLLDALGVVAITTLVASEREPSDPRTDALAVELARRYPFAAQPLSGRCVIPDPELVRASLRACQAMHGGRGRVLVRSGPLGRRCWVEGRWVRLE